MKRRQFGAMLATATLSLGSLSGAAAKASAQETDSLEVEDVSVDLGGIASSVGRATLAFDDGTMDFQLEDWTMESAERSLSIGETQVTAEDVDAETYATVRESMVEAFEGQSLSPLLTALAEAEIDSDSSVTVVAGPIELDDETAVDQLTASGTAGSVVPEGTRDLVDDGASLEELAALGSSEWSSLTVERGDNQLTLDDVVMQLEGATVSITAPEGEADVSDRSLALEEFSMNVFPPEAIPPAHVEFASDVRQLAADGDLTFSAIRSAAEESGVTVSNTAEAIRSARFELSLAEVTEDGEALVADFETSGTLAELLQVVQSRA